MKFFLILTILFSSYSIADDRRDQLIGVINEELKEISRLSSTLSHRDPNLLLRMAELNLEKARLIREEENKRFLLIDPKKRSRISKKRVYKQSNKFFNQAQKIGQTIARRYRKFKDLDIVYYILAFNAKENGDFSGARKYFQRALKYTKKGSETDRKSKIALANLYYNEQQFRKAYPLYKSALSKKTNKWWTKDAYNMAWCAYKLRKYDEAVEVMRDVAGTSKNKKFIDMESLSNRDLALFYTTAGRYNEALDYYKRNGQDVSKQLINMGKFLLNQEKRTLAQKVIEDSKKYAKTRDDRIEANLILLNLYDKYGNHNMHLKTSYALLKIHKEQVLPDEARELLLFQSKKLGAVLQKQVVSGTYDDVKGAKEKKGEYASAYFGIVAELESKASFKSLLHQAETSYAIGKYDKALEQYDKAYNSALQSKQYKFQLAAVNGMLACLGQKSLDNSYQNKFLLSAYVRYLRLNRKGSKSKKIYERTFNIYMAKNDLVNAEKVLVSFKNTFPSNLVTQEAMVAKIMDYYKDKNDVEKIREWVSRINRGEFKVSKKYAHTVKKYILALQFEQVEKSSSRGDKLAALKGYLSIYHDLKSTESAKKNSAYNIAILFHELGRPQQAAKWLNKAMDLMGNSDILKFEDSLFSMIYEVFNRQYVRESVDLFQKQLTKLCKLKSKKKSVIYRNASKLLIAEGKLNEVLELSSKANSCGVGMSHIRLTNLAIMNSLLDADKWDALNSFVKKIENDSYYHPHIIEPLGKLAKVYTENGRFSLAKSYRAKASNLYRSSLAKKRDIPVEGLDLIASFELEDLEKAIVQLHKVKLRFPDKVFDNLVAKKVELLGGITNKGVEILNIGSGNGIVRSYQLLIESYQRVIEEIRGFTPPGKSKAYVDGFKKQMIGFTEPLKQKSLEYLRNARNQIQKFKILSKHNYWFTSKKRLPIAIEFNYSGNGVIMDRGGKQ